MINAEPSCALRTDRVQAVFYISFYRVIQGDAWEKARAAGLVLRLYYSSPKGLLYF